MSVLISIFGILLTIFFVIGTHETAHFIAARLLGVKVLRFSIGFGKTLFRWHDKQGTEYTLALIPLGGYVKMLDESEEEVSPSELPRAFNRQPFYKKFLIVLAGPAINIFCAFILYWLIFTIGFVTIKPIIGNITPNSIAAEAHLKSNLEIIQVDNQVVSSWTAVLFRIMTHIGNKDHLHLETKDMASKKVQVYELDLSDWHISDLHPDPLSSLGMTPYEPVIPLIIGKITPHSQAEAAKLAVGDKIIAINKVKMKDWEAVITFIYHHPDESIIITIERKGNVIQLPAHIGMQRNLLLQKHGVLGISPNFEWPKSLLRTIKYGPLDAFSHAGQEVINFTYFNIVLFGKIVTGKLSLQSLGGPITIFETAGDALNSGFLAFIGFLAFLSISIGIINLIPIPGLDGGHLLIQFIEFLIRRSIPDRYILILFRLGFIFIIFILVQALINDILRLY